MKDQRFWFSIFAIDVILDLYFVASENIPARYFTKSMLMPLLMVAFAVSTKHWNKPAIFFFIGLFFSWLGDIMLMFDSKMPVLFIVGLIFFLIAHISYIYYFNLIYRQQKEYSKKYSSFPALLIALYILIFLIVLWPGLGELKIPVVIYALTIGTMLLAAVKLTGKIPNTTAGFFLAGAILFIISDSVLAFNKFRQAFPLASISIMLTYCLAQYFLSRGAVIHQTDFRKNGQQ